MRRFLLRLLHPLIARGADAELTREIESHLALLQDDFERKGLSQQEAHDAALRAYGGVEQAKELHRDTRGFSWLDHFFKDVRYGVRGLLRNPTFTLIAVITLALGIGASTAIFSAIKPILLDPLPYPHSSRLLLIWDVFKGERSAVTFHTYREVLVRNRSLDGLTVADRIPWQPTLSGAAQPERLDGQSVSATYFHVLGSAPALGRDFEAADDRLHGPKVVILSGKLWRRRFDSDHRIIGREIRLDDDLWTVIGVMPPEFDNVLSPTAEIWTPLQYDTSHVSQLDTEEWGHHLVMLGRLRTNGTLDQAKRELDRIAHYPIPGFPRALWASLSSGFVLDPLQAYITRGIRPALLAVAGAVVLVLLIACVNISNLLLARGVQRRGEFGLRAALGASQTRLVTQLLVESLVLSVGGGALAIVVTKLGISSFVWLSPSGLPRVNAIALDTGVFVFAFAVTALIGVFVGLVPAVDAGRTVLSPEIQQSSERIAGRHPVIRCALVVAEVALALVLLVSAGLLLRSLERLFAIQPGFLPSQLLTMEIAISGHRYDEPSARHRFAARALDAVRRLPGVLSATSSNVLPFGGFQADAYTYGIEFEDRRSYDVCRYVVSAGYFQTMQIPLRRGRLLGDHDIAGAPQAAVISESLARREFGEADPIGKRAHIGPRDRPWYVVVGVVGNVKQTSLAESQLNAVYITPTQSWFADDTVSIIARTRANLVGPGAAIKNAIWSVDRDQAIVHVATMDKLLENSTAERRLVMIIFEAFALTALILAVVGLYGVLAGSVNDRVREIGIRAALGATRSNILGMVVQQGLHLAGLGIAIGLVAAAVATRALASLLFGVSRLDPITYVAVVVSLVAITALACWAPAWRATKVDPSLALRAE
jgi:putative ABC transport system permease protein